MVQLQYVGHPPGKAADGIRKFHPLPPPVNVSDFATTAPIRAAPYT